MNEKEEKKLRQFSSHLLNDYGFGISQDDPVLPALYLIHCELTDNRTGNEAVAKSITEALEKLNPTVYNFHEADAAWKFKLAESMRWLYAGTSLALIVWGAALWWRWDNDVQHAKEIIIASSGIHRMLLNASNKNENGFMYLEFTKCKGRYIENFKEYYQAGTDTIRVNLGKSD